MFPFRPRKPMLGGKLGRKRKAEAAAAEEEEDAAAKAAAAAAALHLPDTCTSTRRKTRSKTVAEPRKDKTKRKKPTPLAELRNGGPVERAIRSDLDNLRALYDEELARRDSSQPAVVAATNNDGSLLLNSHFAPGSTFRLFKDVYRRGKFGIMHTRCIPPRSDRAEFAQMIYSACLGLLKDSLGNIRSSTGGGSKCETDDGVCDDEDAASAAATVTTADDTTINSAAFALFALYTLYETCPLPEFPSLYDVNNQHSDNRGTESSGDSAVFSEAERAALTALPLGLTGAGEQSRVIYRRAYKSPIRVGHGDYARIVQLQDLCLERKSYCECHRAESYINCLEREDSIKGVDDQDQRRCQCSTAGDCLEIIHRLQSNESFDYCEYAGPCSVEGLAGSAEYFDRVVEPPTDAPDNTQYGTILKNEDMVGHDVPVDLKSELDICGLEPLYADYQKALESVSKAPQLQGGRSSRRSKQSKQTQLVQDALRPVLRTWQRNRSKSKSIVRLNSIQEHFEVGGEASPAHGWLPPTNEDESDSDDSEPEELPRRRSVWNQLERSQRKQDAPSRNEVAIEPNNEEETLESINEEAKETSALPSASPREPTSTVKFSFPRGISTSLEKGIRGALAGIDGDINNNGREEETLPNVVPAPIGGGGDSRRYVDISLDLLEEEGLDMAPDSHMDEDEESIITHHTGYSTIPPAGTGGAAVALRDLLSYANERDDEGEDDGGEEEVWEESANEERSVTSATSGVAKNMLGTLLSQAQPEISGGGGVGSKARRETPKQTAKHKRRKRKTQADVDDVSMVSVPSLAGTGENMLDKLIGQVQKENGDKSSKKSSKRMETRRSQKQDVRSTKRRGKQEQDDFDDGTSVVSAPPAATGGGMLDALMKQADSNTGIDGNEDDKIGDDDEVEDDS